jgi:hypothetical protein
MHGPGQDAPTAPAGPSALLPPPSLDVCLRVPRRAYTWSQSEKKKKEKKKNKPKAKRAKNEITKNADGLTGHGWQAIGGAPGAPRLGKLRFLNRRPLAEASGPRAAPGAGCGMRFLWAVWKTAICCTGTMLQHRTCTNNGLFVFFLLDRSF